MNEATPIVSEPKGYYAYTSSEQIQAFQNFSIDERLRWLEELHEFLSETLTDKQRIIFNKFRSGEI